MGPKYPANSGFDLDVWSGDDVWSLDVEGMFALKDVSPEGEFLMLVMAEY